MIYLHIFSPYQSVHIFNVSPVLYISYRSPNKAIQLLTIFLNCEHKPNLHSYSLDMSLCLYPPPTFFTSHPLLCSHFLLSPLHQLQPSHSHKEQAVRYTGRDRETPISFCCRFNLLCTLIFQGPLQAWCRNHWELR